LARRGVITCMCDVPKRSSRNTSLGHMKRPAFSAAPPRQTHWMNVSRAFDLLDKAIYLPLYIGRLLSGSCHVFVATVCPCQSSGKRSLQIHPLSMGFLLMIHFASSCCSLLMRKATRAHLIIRASMYVEILLYSLTQPLFNLQRTILLCYIP
jgi:hypothetical protein